MTLDTFLDRYIPNETYHHPNRPSPVVVIAQGLLVDADRLEWSVNRTYMQAARAGVSTSYDAVRAAYERRRAANGETRN